MDDIYELYSRYQSTEVATSSTIICTTDNIKMTGNYHHRVWVDAAILHVLVLHVLVGSTAHKVSCKEPMANIFLSTYI